MILVDVIFSFSKFVIIFQMIFAKTFGV